MSTSLYAITNAKLTGQETKAHWNKILEQLRNSNIRHCVSLDKKTNEYIPDEGDWEYRIDAATTYSPFEVYFSGPQILSLTFLSNIGIISTIYRYATLYRFFEFGWVDKIRLQLYEAVQIMGGTEIIYLADNGCDKLSNYFELMALQDVSYEEIKAKMIADLGQPITDYFHLDLLDSYEHISEFFLDDFRDLKEAGNT